MEFITGSKEEFYGFLDSISKDSRLAVISHTDLDGVASMIFLEEILKAKGLLENLKLRKFTDYENNIFKLALPELKKNKISHVFIVDISDNVDSEGLQMLREKFNVFLIDHHPLGELKGDKGIIKAETGYCAAFICYELGKDIFDSENWKWLVHAAIISEMGHRNLEVLEFLQEDYPDIADFNIHKSVPGKITSAISYSLIYFDDTEKVYNLVKNRKIDELKEYEQTIKEEIDKWIRRFEKEAEFYQDRNLYFYYFNPDFDIKSIMTTIVSNKKRDAIFICINDVRESPEFVSVSARNQNKIEDMNKLMKKGIVGLENAIAGGHIPAAGARFLKKDLKKFKENILSD